MPINQLTIMAWPLLAVSAGTLRVMVLPALVVAWGIAVWIVARHLDAR